MQKLNYLAFAVLGLFFCGTSHQDQTFNENIIIGAEDNQMGEGKRLYFGWSGENFDPFYISRFDRGNNQSDLRINISDDNFDDRLVMGTSWAGLAVSFTLTLLSNLMAV